MTKMELEAKLANVSDIEGLIAAVQNESDENRVLESFKQYGIEFNTEDIAYFTSAEDELDADQLDTVAGGCGCGGWLQHVVWTLLNWAVGKKFSKHSDGSN